MRRVNLLAVSFLVLSGSSIASEPEDTIEMCDAIRLSGQSVQLRGVARVTESGFLMSDGSCPMWSVKGQTIPMMIRVTAKEFLRGIDRRLFDEMGDNIEKPLLQIVAKGRISCRTPVRITADTGAGSIRGNGFGPTGLVVCTIEGATIAGIWVLG